jgi:Probable transposase
MAWRAGPSAQSNRCCASWRRRSPHSSAASAAAPNPGSRACARDRYHAADFRVGDGLTIRKSGKLGCVGVPGEIKVRWHRELPSAPTSAILTRQAGKWYVVFHVEIEAAEQVNGASLGIDLGLTSLAALSNGQRIGRPNITKTNARKLRRLQRAFARCQRGSRVRRRRKAAVTTLQAHIGNSRRDYLHKVSADLVFRVSAHCRRRPQHQRSRRRQADEACSRCLLGAIDRDARLQSCKSWWSDRQGRSKRHKSDVP